MNSHLLLNAFVFLVAACLVVPLAGRLRLGSVLGYLVAGVLIGPYGIGLINNSEQILHFAEFGIIMMLFIIGIELDLATLWRLRRAVLGLGGLQVIITSLILAAMGMMLGFNWQTSLACGLTLSLSSTALVLQLLQEKGLLHTAPGEAAFSVLLLQDIAAIPILIIFPLLAPPGTTPISLEHNFFSTSPGWVHASAIAGAIAIIIFGGRYASRHIFRYIAKTNLREIFTAIALALVVGITLLMNTIGVSPALGAFVAGLVLAKSEYRHTLESDIQPFKGLLVGLFFVSVGMQMNFGIVAQNPLILIGILISLIAIKAIILLGLGFLSSLNRPQRTLFALALSQGGEFAFVLLQYATGLHLLKPNQSAFLMMIVALSMATTPLLMIINEHFIVPRFMSKLPPPKYDAMENKHNPVIIAGFGRFGQVIGRFLRVQGIKYTILEKDPDQIELLRRYGNKAFFGDASRMDLLENAGAHEAKLLVVAIDNANEALKIVQEARHTFPKLTIFVRARNRRHAYELQKAGAHFFHRELFDASLQMAQEIMHFLGGDPEDIHHKAQFFREHDEKTLKASFAFFENEPELTEFAKQAAHELEQIIRSDISEKDGR